MEFSCAIPPEELSALKGCVSRNRALFSPTALADSVHIQSGDLKESTWPDLIPSHENKILYSESSPTAENPSQYYSHGALPYSISVQFGGVNLKEDHTPSMKCMLPIEKAMPGGDCNSVSQGGNSRFFPVSASIPGSLNSPGLRFFQKMGKMGHSSSCCSCHGDGRLPANNLPDKLFVRTKSLDEKDALTPDSTHLFCPYQPYIHPSRGNLLSLNYISFHINYYFLFSWM